MLFGAGKLSELPAETARLGVEREQRAAAEAAAARPGSSCAGVFQQKDIQPPFNLRGVFTAGPDGGLVP